MDTIDVFSTKAAKYARYRWDYAPRAVQTILGETRVCQASFVADIGAGTGILTRHFVGKVGHVFAVEPNAEMRQMAARALGTHPSCHIVDGRAEATTLPGRSIDLITVAQSIHWFEPHPTKAEFLRILKPGGWLAVLRNYATDDELGQALREAFPGGKDLDRAALMRGRGMPTSFYYDGDAFLRQTFSFTTRQNWPEFIGALCTASDAPDEDSSRYAGFERVARRVFECFSSGGLLESHAATELCLGQITGAGERGEPAGSHA